MGNNIFNDYVRGKKHKVATKFRILLDDRGNNIFLMIQRNRGIISEVVI